MSSSDVQTAAPNAKWLLWAGFTAILAAGVGFGIRGGILDNWGTEFGFTAAQLGDITGAGLTGFCFGIIIGGVVADSVGYGWLVAAAFGFHVLSAFVTFAAAPEQSSDVSFALLYWGTFIFAVANGTLEAVANPLVATLFPKNRTHYLNILHASWPAGLIFGGAAGWVLDDNSLNLFSGSIYWKWQLALFLVPTVIYGLMFVGQKMPKSEASASGLSLGEMFGDVGVLGGAVVCGLLALFFANAMGLEGGAAAAMAGGLLVVLLLITHRHGDRGATIIPMGAFLLFVLFCTHALVGAVELGTDGWIQNITGNILTSGQGKILFVYTSALMFALRFCAHFIEQKLKLSPVGILLVCAVLAAIGLNLVSGVVTFWGALLALSIYGIGKTFFWPTMLAVASDRYPRTGAIAISIMGGIGMMSAGLIGSPGLGYGKDRFAGEALQEADPAVYAEYKADEPSSFLFFEECYGLDAKETGAIQAKLNAAREILETGEVEEPDDAALGALDPAARAAAEVDLAQKKEIAAMLEAEGVLTEDADPDDALVVLSEEERAVHEAAIAGDRRTLVADSVIPATMAVIYLLLLLYFRNIGGYRPLSLADIAEAGDRGTAES